ncbi:vWA domain-containing protein [Kitasatospora phosalacinea]|uniref:VWA domain-containing protein n=1 Tax=Kitasatospora phosalacinea TaxID=2065 RepID=A0ABW6GT67_9ACTN
MPRATTTASALTALAVLGTVGTVGAAPAAVPAPGAGEAVVTVRTGGDRTGAQSVGPLAGVRLGLFAAAGDAAPVDPGWGVCVSDAAGDCSFTVPDTAPGGANAGRELTVRQLDGGVPAGWFANPVLRTGPGSGSGSVPSPYAFRTPALAAGNTYRSTADFMVSDDYKNLPTASGGVWQDSRDNPPLPARCGLDVALVLDLSASVGGELPFLKAAADRFTDALTGTPSRLAVFSFDQASPATSVSANHPELHPVSTPAGAAEFKSLYAGWTLGKGTNWDTALWSVAQAAPAYDAVVVLTDGNPTRFADDKQGDGSNTHFRDVENGIFSANSVKAKGSRLIALGVGKGVEGDSGLNLRALSGPTAYAEGGDLAAADYFQTKDFATAGQQLHDLALTHCDNSVTVVKQLVPAGTTGEDTTGAVNAPAGWTFTATGRTPGVGGLPEERTTTDDGTGSVVFQPELGELPSAALDISELQHEGYELVTKGGKNAVCVNLDTGQPVEVADTGSADRPGFALELPRLAAVSCTVYNRPAAAADLTVDKTWRIDGTTHPEGTQPAGFTATASLTGPDGAAASPQPWGTARTGYRVGDRATVDEQAQLADPSCRLTDRRITALNGSPVDLPLGSALTLDSAHTRAEVTNTVECDHRTPSPSPSTSPAGPTPPGPTPPGGGHLAATGGGGVAALLPAAGAAVLAGLALLAVRGRPVRRRRNGT